MLIKHGLGHKKKLFGKFHVKDKHALSFHRTFGSLTSLDAIPDFNLDAGLTNFAQNEPNPVFGTPAIPEGCTGMTQSDIGTDIFKIVFSPLFTLEKTCEIEGINTLGPCTMDASSKAVIVYGLQAKGETDQQALVHKLVQSFVVEPINGDWFLGMVSAMYHPNGSSISLAGTWTETYEMPINGIVGHPKPADGSSGHNWKICGLKRVLGVPYLIAKPWLGPRWAGNSSIGLAGGFCLFSREEINYVMKQPAAEALCFSAATVADAQKVRLSIWQVLLNYLQRLAALTQPLRGTLILNDQLFQKFKAELDTIETEFESMTGIVVPRLNPRTLRPVLPIKQKTMTQDIDALPVSFDTPQQAFHAVRVLCDLANVPFSLKDIITACIYVESGFHNYQSDGAPTKHENRREDGTIASTDWGICQINDYYHIKPHGGPFASVEYVLENPEEVVNWMIQMFLHGGAKQWVSYSSGAYKPFLPRESVMWHLDVHHPGV